MDWVDALNTLLHNVIAVLILHALQHVAVQLLCNLHLTHSHSSDSTFHPQNDSNSDRFLMCKMSSELYK